MAIYHLHAKIVSREKGESVVASAAYRAAEKLYDQRLGRTWDYTRKVGVEYSEILTPPEAPSWARNREVLWNMVEAVERRKDAQLAREVRIALPIELTTDQQITLLRDFARDTFVARGMVADVALHLDNPDNPHAHILLSLRGITPQGFVGKRRDWNSSKELEAWRTEWEEIQNRHLALAGLDVRVDHRTLEEQGIDLVPGRKIGVSAERQKRADLPPNVKERVLEQRAIAFENGCRIIEDPELALRALTHTRATFTKRDIGKYLHTRTDGAEQFDLAFLKVSTSAELVKLATDDRGTVRYTTREMLQVEDNLLERAGRLAKSSQHDVSPQLQSRILAESKLYPEQQKAFEHVTGHSDLSIVVGVAGAGKSTMLNAARKAWEAAGYTVKGGALAGIAAENLEGSSGISSRTLASWELSWSKGRELLGKGDVFVIDESGLIGSRQLSRILESAEKAGAKVVLLGDPEQLQPIEAGAAFRGIAERSEIVEMTHAVRQSIEWQREATEKLATDSAWEGLKAYRGHGAITVAPTKTDAWKALLQAWKDAARNHPDQTRLMLAYTREEVRTLNEQAREVRRAAGELGHTEVIQTENGAREFAEGDRVYFLHNDRGLKVKNGSLGTVEKMGRGILQIRMDGQEARRVTVDSVLYPHLDHGYATTVHKSQSATVDRTFTLATPYFDRHATYVALSRHRNDTQMFYAAKDFGGGPDGRSASAEEVYKQFEAVVSRARPKDLAHDYFDIAVSTTPDPVKRKPRTMDEIDQIQQSGAERWAAKQQARRLGLPEQPEQPLNPDIAPPEPDINDSNSLHRRPRSLEDDLDL